VGINAVFPNNAKQHYAAIIVPTLERRKHTLKIHVGTNESNEMELFLGL